MKWLSSEKLTYNYHKWGITSQTFKSRTDLQNFYTVFSTSRDRNGIEFISSMEG